MTFTDDNLKQLKKYLEQDGEDFPMDNELRALLARLEAAEGVIDSYIAISGDDDPDYQHLNFAMEAWRESKGEAGE